MIRVFLCAIVFLLLPITLLANVRITEIMYDLEVSDTDREWVEIFNDGTEQVDLTDWKFFEANTNHGLTSSGSMTLAPGAYAIIVQKVEAFTGDWPNISALVLDSSFSLNNETGEMLEIRASDGSISDSVTYDPNVGGKGDGRSLQRVSGVWGAGTPTPGSANATQGSSPPPPGSSSNSQTASGGSATPATLEEPNFRADAGADMVGVTGAPVFFDGMGYGLEGKPLENAWYSWNFGDGSVTGGQHITHTFMYPGSYAVTLNVSSGKFSASDRVVVTINNADVMISYAGSDKIELHNRSEHDLDLSDWQLTHKNAMFMFPKNTILLAKHIGVFPSSVTKLFVVYPEDVSLLYPNGVVAVSYENKTAPAPLAIEQYHESQRETSAKSVAKQTTYSSYTSDNVSTGEEQGKTDALADVRGETMQAAASGTEDKEGTLYPWLVALISIISVASVLVLSRVRLEPVVTKDSQKTELTADDFTIEEEKD